MDKTILITGAGGYIGSEATYEFLQKGYKVVALDDFSTGFSDPLHVLQARFGQDMLQIHEGKINEKIDSVLESEKIDAVIHYAANCSVDESMRDPYKYFTNNTISSLQLLQAMDEHGVKKIVFSSTCAVYGEVKTVPIHEAASTHPTNPYGESKLMTEELLAWYQKLKGIEYVALRYFNVCGASTDGLIGDSKKPSMHLVQNAVRGALGIEPFYLTCPEVDTPDKSPIRDYVNVVDLNSAHLKAVEYLLNGGKSEIINLGTGKGNSVLEIIHAIEEKTGVKIPLERNNGRKGEYARMIADTAKAQELLGWSAKHTLEDSIDSLITWYNKHPNGWQQ